MEVHCPYCDAKNEIDDAELEPHYNDWFEDFTCVECGERFDMFIELEPVAVTYGQRFFKCAECGNHTKHIKLRRNPYAEDNKRYCESCFNENVVKWANQLKAEAEAQKQAKKQKRSTSKTTNKVKDKKTDKK